MTSPPEKQPPPHDWWLENACRIAAFRLRQHRCISANTVPIREQVRDSVEFRTSGVGRERAAPARGGLMLRASRNNRLSSAWRCPHCHAEVDARTFRLDPADANKLLCPSRACGRSFEWKRQNKGKLWPEQRAYTVLR